ncbi:MAG: hypothetical protein PHQ43_12345 [Dehalococcoidales bacterium]|nr:hypothetical protein [Dehalococcoidales bacterium]
MVTDEPTKTLQDSPQPEAEPAPAGDLGTPMGEPTKTYTEADIQMAKAAAGREWGRKLKAVEVERDTLRAQLTTVESQMADTNKRIGDLESLIEKNEEEAAKADPEAAAALRLKREGRQLRAQLEEQKRNLEREKAQWQKDLDAAKAYAKERTAKEVGEEYGVDHSLLAEIVPDGDRDKMVAVAKKLPKTAAQAPTPKPDSLQGGSGRTYQELRDAYINNPHDPKIAAAYLKARKEKGLPC